MSRPATPAPDEGLAFARYLDEAAEGFFGLMLGKRAPEIIATAYAEPDHDLSYQNATFAERDGKIVGMVAGFTAEQHRRSSLEPLERAADRSLRMRTVNLLFRPLMRILDTVDDRDYYLQAIAVDPEVRGGGVSAVLMDSLVERARASGADRLALDVSANNGRARRFYERHGFTVESRWPKRVPVPGFTLYRMTKEL